VTRPPDRGVDRPGVDRPGVDRPGVDRPLARRLAEVAFPVLAVATALIAPLPVFARLPDPVAAHWGLGGAPDGALPLVVDVVLLAVVVLVVGAGPCLAARGAVPRDQARVLLGVAGGTSVLLAGLRVASLQANLDAPTWDAATALPGSTLLVTAGVTVLAVLVGVTAAGDRPDRAPALTSPADVGVTPGDPVVWSGVASSRGGVIAAMGALSVTALSALVVPAEGRLVLVVAAVAAAAVAATLGQVRLTVGPAGVTARLGWFGWPRVHVPIADVGEVRIEQVVPYEYGGWGWRLVPGVSAIIVRRGPGLRIARRTGRTLVVTIDDAGRAAGVLEAHREAYRATTSTS
jgi:hypothetical protein